MVVALYCAKYRILGCAGWQLQALHKHAGLASGAERDDETSSIGAGYALKILAVEPVVRRARFEACLLCPFGMQSGIWQSAWGDIRDVVLARADCRELVELISGNSLFDLPVLAGCV